MRTIKKLLPVLWCLLTISAYSQKNEIQERKQKMNTGWLFTLDNIKDASSPDFDDSGWRKLDLPHDWSIEGKVDARNPMGNDGGYFPAGMLVQKKFYYSTRLQGKAVNALFRRGVYEC